MAEEVVVERGPLDPTDVDEELNVELIRRVPRLDVARTVSAARGAAPRSSRSGEPTRERVVAQAQMSVQVEEIGEADEPGDPS